MSTSTESEFIVCLLPPLSNPTKNKFYFRMSLVHSMSLVWVVYINVGMSLVWVVYINVGMSLVYINMGMSLVNTWMKFEFFVTIKFSYWYVVSFSICSIALE